MRLFYGWIIVAVAFVTMAIGVNARTAFSLLFPPIVDEFGWPRAETAGAFSFGFLVSALLSPLLGKLMDRFGPRTVVALGVAAMGIGLGLAAAVSKTWQLYGTLGVLVGGVKRLRPAGGSLALVCTDENITKIFEITGLDRVFPIHESRSEALEAVKSPAAD